MFTETCLKVSWLRRINTPKTLGAWYRPFSAMRLSVRALILWQKSLCRLTAVKIGMTKVEGEGPNKLGTVGLYWFPVTTVESYHISVAQNDRNGFSHSPGGQKSVSLDWNQGVGRSGHDPSNPWWLLASLGLWFHHPISASGVTSPSPLALEISPCWTTLIKTLVTIFSPQPQDEG